MAYWSSPLITYSSEIILLNFQTSLRSQLKNSCFVFHQGFQPPRNNKSTPPSSSCFHPFLGVWNPWWKTCTRFWSITSTVNWRHLVYRVLDFLESSKSIDSISTCIHKHPGMPGYKKHNRPRTSTTLHLTDFNRTRDSGLALVSFSSYTVALNTRSAEKYVCSDSH